MRNLKRALSLALAVVMVIGLMVVGAGAADVKYDDFGDKAEIKNEEAVRLLVDLGVINGGNDGNFAPKGTLTRGQFAKIAYLLSQTQTDYTRYAGTGIAKDAAGHWAEGALVWCNTWRNQIITGGNDGNFYPEDTLTVVQCAVMMLRVLGYNNYLEGFTGAGWEIRTLNKADEVGLMEGLESLKAGDPISRDDACRMAYNALFKDRVYHEEQWNPAAQTMVPTGYDKDHYTAGTDDTLAAATFKVTPKTAAADGSDPAGLVRTPDMLGVDVTYYEKDGKVLSAAPAASVKVVATIDGSELEAKTTGKDAYKLADDVVYCVNGEEGADTDVDIGSVVELINTDNDADINVVRVTNKTVDTLDKDPEVSEDGKKVSVDFKNDANDIASADINKVSGYAGLKAGDVVLFVELNGVTYIEKTQKVTGKITAAASDKSYYTVNGAKMPFSALDGTQDPADKTDFKNEYDFYLDNGGNIVAFAQAGEKPVEPEKLYAVTSAFGYEKVGSDTGIGGSANTTYQIAFILPDGTKTSALTLASYTTKDGTKYEKSSLTTDAITTLKGANVGKLVEYTEKDGKYTVTEIGTAGATTNAITGGKPVFSGTLVGNANTTFLLMVGEDEKAKLQVVTGIANLPSASADSGNITSIQYIEKDGFVTIAYIEVKKLADKTTSDLVYFVDNTKTEETADGYVVAVVKDGKVVNATITADGYKTIVTDGSITKGLATVTRDKDGNIVGATKVTTPADEGITELAGLADKGGMIEVTGGKVYQVAADATVVLVSESGAKELKVEDVAKTLKNDKNTYAGLAEIDKDTDTIESIIIISTKKP